MSAQSSRRLELELETVPFWQGVGECPADPGYEAGYRVFNHVIFCLVCGGNHEPLESSQREIRAGQ